MPLAELPSRGLNLSGWNIGANTVDRTNVDERRIDSRAPLTLPVRLQIEGTDQVLDFRTRDVSEGGIFIETDSPCPIGTQFKAEVFMPTVNMTIEARGTVVRSIPEGSGIDGPIGMAIRFTDHGDFGWDFLAHFVESYLADHSS